MRSLSSSLSLLFVLLSSPLFAQGPVPPPPPSSVRPPLPRLLIAFSQILGSDTQIPRVFRTLAAAAERRGGFFVIPEALTKAQFRDYGLAAFGLCKTPRCIEGKAKNVQADILFLIHLAEILGRVVVKITAYDFRSPQPPRTFKVTERIDDLPKRTEEIFSSLLPANATLIIEGTPEGAEISLEEKTVGKLPHATLPLREGTFSFTISAPTFQAKTLDVSLRVGETKTLRVSLLPVSPLTRPPPPAASSAWYRQWWVWAIVGGVAVAGTTTTLVLLLNRPVAFQLRP